MMQPKVSTGKGKSREEIIGEMAKFLQDKTPEIFDLEKIGKKYPTAYEEFVFRLHQANMIDFSDRWECFVVFCVQKGQVRGGVWDCRATNYDPSKMRIASAAALAF